MSRIPAALVLCGVAVFAAEPAVASAGTLSVDRPCYAHVPASSAETVTQPILVTVTGGTPGADFQVAAGKKTGDGGSGSATGTFGANGTGQAVIRNVFPPSGHTAPIEGETLHLTAHDFGSGLDIATGTAKITNVAIAVGTKPSNPYSRRTVKVSGLTPLYGSGTLFGSYVSGTKGKRVVKRVKLGRPNGCGYVSVKRVLPPKHGFHKWTLYVHEGKALNRSHSLVYSFRVYKKFF